MSLQAMGLVWESNLHTTEKFVMLALADHANDNGQSCYPSIATISRKTSMSERTVQRAIQSLLAAGIVSEYWQRGQMRQKEVRHFKLNLPGLEPARQPIYGNCPKILRAATIAMFDQTCIYCKKPGDSINGPDLRKWQIDRIIPGKLGGLYVAENVTLSCATCNLTKGAKMAPLQTKSMGCHFDEKGVPTTTERGARLTPESSLTIKNPQQEALNTPSRGPKKISELGDAVLAKMKQRQRI